MLGREFAQRDHPLPGSASDCRLVARIARPGWRCSITPMYGHQQLQRPIASVDDEEPVSGQQPDLGQHRRSGVGVDHAGAPRLAATTRASAVFPAPGGPVSVTRRV